MVKLSTGSPGGAWAAAVGASCFAAAAETPITPNPRPSARPTTAPSLVNLPNLLSFMAHLLKWAGSTEST